MFAIILSCAGATKAATNAPVVAPVDGPQHLVGLLVVVVAAVVVLTAGGEISPQKDSGGEQPSTRSELRVNLNSSLVP